MSSLLGLARISRHGFIVGRQEFAGFWKWYSWLAGWLPRIIAQAAFFALLGRLLDDPERLRFLVIGNAMLAGCVTTFIAIPASSWDRFDGTYPLLVASPSGLFPAIVGRTAVWPLNGVVTSFVALLAVSAIFGISLPWPNAILLLPVIALTVASVFAFAMFLGAFIARLPRARNIVYNMAAIVLMAFCGVSVPVSFWPAWVEVASNLLPLTHGLQAIRLILDQGSLPMVLEKLGLEVVVGVTWLLASLVLIDRLADAGRKNGSIDFV